MPKKRFVTEKRYNVEWYSNGFCYRTILDVPFEEVKNMRLTAKLLEETIKIEHTKTIKYEVS